MPQAARVVTSAIALSLVAGVTACSSDDEPTGSQPTQGSSASPTATPTEAGLRYKDSRFSFEGGTPPDGSDCRTFTALFTSQGPQVSEEEDFGPGSSAPLVFLNCGDGAKVRIGGGTLRQAVEATGPQNRQSCQQAAERSQAPPDDIPLAELRAGRQFCLYGDASANTLLLKVVSVSPSTRSMTWTATNWFNPNG